MANPPPRRSDGPAAVPALPPSLDPRGSRTPRPSGSWCRGRGPRRPAGIGPAGRGPPASMPPAPPADAWSGTDPLQRDGDPRPARTFRSRGPLGSGRRRTERRARPARVGRPGAPCRHRRRRRPDRHHQRRPGPWRVQHRHHRRRRSRHPGRRAVPPCSRSSSRRRWSTRGGIGCHALPPLRRPARPAGRSSTRAANWLVYGFPAIAAATAAVLIIAGIRLISGR